MNKFIDYERKNINKYGFKNLIRKNSKFRLIYDTPFANYLLQFVLKKKLRSPKTTIIFSDYGRILGWGTCISLKKYINKKIYSSELDMLKYLSELNYNMGGKFVVEYKDGEIIDYLMIKDVKLLHNNLHKLHKLHK